MEINQLLAEQFAVTNHSKNWFACLQSAVEGISAEHASRKNENGNHSVWEILNHLYYWNERHLRKLKGIPLEKMKGDNKLTFENEQKNISESEWEIFLKTFFEMMNELENEIGKCDEVKLKSFISEENKSPWYSIISNMNLHNAYHAGQIVLIRKMQESWSEKNGVK